MAALHCLTLLCMALITQLQQRGILHQAATQPLLQHAWTATQTTAQIVVVVLLLPLALALVLLTLWNLHLLLKNKTSIEYQEGVTARIRAARCAGDHVMYCLLVLTRLYFTSISRLLLVNMLHTPILLLFNS